MKHLVLELDIVINFVFIFMDNIGDSKKQLLSCSWGNTNKITEETHRVGFSYV